MISRILDYVKLHKLTVVLFLALLYVLVKQFSPNPIQPLSLQFSTTSKGVASPAVYETGMDSFKGLGTPSIMPREDFAPTRGIKDRLVVENSYLSLLVKDVLDVRKRVLSYTTEVGGYMVSAETSNPQDAPTATITVRIPSDRLEASLEIFRGLGVKVVSENLVGTDVTDQYVDIDARIETLEKTKTSMQAILARAELISDITNITQQIISIQTQIDSYRGTQKSLEENSKLAKVTLYLSTDEIALPYAPSETWRPEVVFKLAVRALVSNLRSLGTLAIWAAVFSIIWVPIVVVLYLLNKRFGKKPTV